MTVNVCQNYSHSKLLINLQCELNKSGEQSSKLNIKTGFEEIFGTAIDASPFSNRCKLFSRPYSKLMIVLYQ